MYGECHLNIFKSALSLGGLIGSQAVRRMSLWEEPQAHLVFFGGGFAKINLKGQMQGS